MPTEKNYRILLADDDVTLTSILGEELRSLDYEVDVCENGLVALQHIILTKPHLVLLDHGMPGMDGLTLCRKLRTLGVGVRVIFVSAASRLEAKVAGLDAGADDYLTKPYDVEELLARIRVQLRNTVPAATTRTHAESLIGALGDPRAELRDSARRVIAQQADTGLHFQLFGDFKLAWQGIDLTQLLWNRRKPIMVLKLLLAHYGRIVLTDVIEEALWPQLAPVNARRSLYVAIGRLRQSLDPFGPGRVETVVGGYRFHLAASDDLDLRQFDRLAHTARLGLGEKQTCGGAIDAITEMSEIYTGDPLADELYAEWASPIRTQVRSEFVDLLRRASMILRSQGKLEEASFFLCRLLELEPTEPQHAQDLAQCLKEHGNDASASNLLARTNRTLNEFYP
jgi:DNA-binding response OmpR family regulator